VEESVVQAPGERSPFKGCYFAADDGSGGDQKPYVFIRMKHLISPLKGDFNVFVYLGSDGDRPEKPVVWEDGMWVFPVDSHDYTDPKWCDGQQKLKLSLIKARSGLSADRQSYEIDIPCETGKSQGIYNFKLSDGNLIGKLEMRRWNGPSYFYCWK
jgi:hypothetical protein